MKIWTYDDTGSRFLDVPVDSQGVNCLVTLDKPVMAKDGKLYSFVHGRVWTGYSGTTGSDNKSRISIPYMQIGEESDVNRLNIPMSNVLGVQECHKVLNDEKILVIK